MGADPIQDTRNSPCKVLTAYLPSLPNSMVCPCPFFSAIDALGKRYALTIILMSAGLPK